MKLLLSLLVFVSSSAFAASINDVAIGKPACFGREYSEAHMTKALDQTVKKMSVKFTKNADSGDMIFMSIDASIKKTISSHDEDGIDNSYTVYKPYSTGMICDKAGSNKLNCYIECDGGSAVVSWDVKTAANEISIQNNGFVMYGGCGEDVEENDTIWLDNKKGGDDVFKLFALPAEYCVD